MIKFKELSTPLKIGVIGGMIYLTLTIIEITLIILTGLIETSI